MKKREIVQDIIEMTDLDESQYRIYSGGDARINKSGWYKIRQRLKKCYSPKQKLGVQHL